MKNNMKSLAFFTCYFILLVDCTFRYVNDIDAILHAVYMYITIPLLCLLIFDNIRKLQFKKLLLVALFLLVGAATHFISGNNTLLTIILFVCAFKSIDMDNLLKFSIAVRLIFLTILFMLFCLGLTKASVYIREDGIARYALGFGNLNNLSTYILSLVLQIVYLHRKNIRAIDILIALVGLLSIVFITASRTHAFILLFLMVYMIVKLVTNRHSDNVMRVKNKLIRLFCAHSFFIMAVVSVCLYLLYAEGSQIAQQINVVSSGRISTASKIIDINGLSMWGQPVDRYSVYGDHIPLDNVYAYIILYFGPVISLIFAYVYRKCTESYFDKKDDLGAIELVIFSIIGLSEHFALEITYNPFLLHMSNYLLGDDKRKERNDKK